MLKEQLTFSESLFVEVENKFNLYIQTNNKEEEILSYICGKFMEEQKLVGSTVLLTLN